jgi:hypothetical protein
MPLLEIAGGIASRTALSVAEPLLVDLTGVQDQQLEMLKDIRADVRRLREAPWRRARLLVREAAEAANDDFRRSDYLEKARDALLEAYANQPDVDRCRPAIAVERAMVLGLLDRRDECDRWSAIAHTDAVAVVNARIRHLQSAINQRGRLDAVREVAWFFKSSKDPDGTEGPTNFWKHFEGYLGSTDPEHRLAVQVTRQTFETGVWPSEDFFHGPHDLAKTAVAFTAQTRPGRQLLRLHEAAREAEDYRQVCVVLRPTLKLPQRKLTVDLSTPYKARIAWEHGSAAC